MVAAPRVFSSGGGKHTSSSAFGEVASASESCSCSTKVGRRELVRCRHRRRSLGAILVIVPARSLIRRWSGSANASTELGGEGERDETLEGNRTERTLRAVDPLRSMPMAWSIPWKPGDSMSGSSHTAQSSPERGRTASTVSSGRRWEVAVLERGSECG